MRRIITVGREFGSGGREIGRRIAEELQIAYYDQEIITEIAKRTALSEAYIRQIDIIKGENKITVPGYTGHGQKRGALFTVNGEYIYTVHSDHKKYAPCKIKIDTGEIIYTDGEN